MANSGNYLRLFLCPELWQWYQSDDEDENKDTNLLQQASDEFQHAEAACGITSAVLLPTPGF